MDKKKTQGISLSTHKCLGKKESIYHKTCSENPTTVQKEEKILSFLLLNESRQSYVCASHPHFEQTLTVSVQTVMLLIGKKTKMFFQLYCNGSAIIYKSMFMLIFCLHRVWVRKDGERWRLHIRNILSFAPRFSERILTMSNKGHRFNCPVWPGQPRPPTRSIYTVLHTRTHKLELCNEEGGIFKNTN